MIKPSAGLNIREIRKEPQNPILRATPNTNPTKNAPKSQSAINMLKGLRFNECTNKNKTPVGTFVIR